MFYPVRILDGRGKLKKVVSTKTLSHKYWRQFDEMLAGKMTIIRRQPNARRPTYDYDPRFDLDDTDF